MERRQYLIDYITQKLTFLQLRIINNNSLNLTDINIVAENFFRDLLNLLGRNLKNTNFSKKNNAFIDLIDIDNSLAIQVTSQSDNKKIKESIEGFFGNKEHTTYKLKLLLIAKDAKKYKTDFGDKFNAKEDIIDVKKLLGEINDKDTQTLVKIVDFLKLNSISETTITESSEVQTIMSLIQYLSKPQNRVISDKAGIVDPDEKINNRFSTHSEYILEKYAELAPVYYSALRTASKDLDAVMSILIASYLKDESDTVLRRQDNNPKAAIDEMVNFFYEKLSENIVSTFDKQAIRFFLLDEMIKCNVFPNP